MIEENIIRYSLQSITQTIMKPKLDKHETKKLQISIVFLPRPLVSNLILYDWVMKEM